MRSRETQNDDSLIDTMDNADFYMNLAALLVYVTFFVALMIVKKGRIDNSAKIICIGYPLGIIA